MRFAFLALRLHARLHAHTARALRSCEKLLGVDQQVHRDLADLVTIGMDIGQRLGKREFKRNAVGAVAVLQS